MREMKYVESLASQDMVRLSGFNSETLNFFCNRILFAFIWLVIKKYGLINCLHFPPVWHKKSLSHGLSSRLVTGRISAVHGFGFTQARNDAGEFRVLDPLWGERARRMRRLPSSTPHDRLQIFRHCPHLFYFASNTNCKSTLWIHSVIRSFNSMRSWIFHPTTAPPPPPAAERSRFAWLRVKWSFKCRPIQLIAINNQPSIKPRAQEGWLWLVRFPKCWS